MSKKRKMKRRRCVTVTVLFMVIMSAMVNYALAKRSEPERICVVVKSGESVWTIAKNNNPNNMDIRKLVYKIMDENDISDGIIYAGQELSIPVN